MRHPDEDALATCALGEIEDAEREAVLSHVASCKRCAAELESLRMMLAAVADLPVPHRDESYGRRVWAHIEPRLPRAQPRAHRAIDSWRPWLAAAAVLLVVAGAFLAGRWSFAPRHAPVESRARAAAPDPSTIHDRVVLAALGDHLDRAERGLVELVNADADGTIDISAEQTWARDLLDANRLYRQSAGGAASPVVGDLLGELEPVLLELVHSPSRLSAAEFDALRARIEDRSLVFKVRVSGADVRARARTLRRPGDQTS